MAIPTNIEILPPWKVIEPTPDGAPGFHATELYKEICAGHVLYGVKVKAVALRVDRDDVLFELVDQKCPLAVVHLTWRKETTPAWPSAKLFESWERWVRDEMIPSHEDYQL